MKYLNQSFIMTVAIIFMAIGMLYQVAIGVMYQKMIQASDTMTGIESKFLRQCKDRFVKCYQLNGGVPNVSVFVDKYIQRIHFMGMSMNFIKHLSGQLMLAGVFIAGFGACKGIMEGRRFVDLLPFYIVSLFGIYLFLSITSIVDMQGRKQNLKTNLMDYLENHVAERLEHGMVEKEKMLNESAKEKIQKNDENEMRLDFSKEEAKELEELLKSFMV